nr:glycosyltransferase family A protein [uncultured Sphingomonas sp.]
MIAHASDPIRFSVVIALHDKRAYVADAVRSIVAQTVPAIEIIVVDDGSADGGADVVAAMDCPNLILIRQSCAGPGPARNRAMSEANGNYIAFLDADDLWRADHLEMLERTAQVFPGAVLVATDFIPFSGKPPSLIPTSQAGASPRQYDFFRETVDGDRIWVGDAAVRREAAIECGGFGNFIPGEDRWLWQSLALHGQFAVIDAQTAFYRRSVGGIMERIEQTGETEPEVAPDLVQLEDYLIANPGHPDAENIRHFVAVQW